MSRYLFSRTDNHQIARDSLTGRERGLRRQAWDPVSEVPDGISHGRKIESTNFSFDAVWGVDVGSPARSRDLWRHPTTGLPFTVNPRWYIIEVPTIPVDGVTSKVVFEEGEDDIVTGLQRQRRKRRMQPTSFTAGQLAELNATHRLRLTLAEFSAVIGLRIVL